MVSEFGSGVSQTCSPVEMRRPVLTLASDRFAGTSHPSQVASGQALIPSGSLILIQIIVVVGLDSKIGLSNVSKLGGCLMDGTCATRSARRSELKSAARHICT